ncbi:MAG: hypothetical protein Q9173_004899 [Seirophora scorigena]
MDGVTIAASLVSIGGAAGCEIAIKIYTLATQISAAYDRISSISNDVSLTSSVLQQLGDLMAQKAADDGTNIFSWTGLETTKSSAAICEDSRKSSKQQGMQASKSEEKSGNHGSNAGQNLTRSPCGGKIHPSPGSPIYSHEREGETLRLSLLQPSIRNLMDVIQLSWEKHQVLMLQDELRMQVNKHRHKGSQAVSESYENLYLYEHDVIVNEITTASTGASLKSLKRSSIDLWHREILFIGVPGLHFILEHIVPRKMSCSAANNANEIWSKNLASHQSLTRDNEHNSLPPSLKTKNKSLQFDNAYLPKPKDPTLSSLPGLDD